MQRAADHVCQVELLGDLQRLGSQPSRLGGIPSPPGDLGQPHQHV
jgi:hypothetical protein